MVSVWRASMENGQRELYRFDGRAFDALSQTLSISVYRIGLVLIAPLVFSINKKLFHLASFTHFLHPL